MTLTGTVKRAMLALTAMLLAGQGPKPRLRFLAALLPVALGLAGLVAEASATPVELVVNGEFEANDISGVGFGIWINDATVPGWSSDEGQIELWEEGLSGSPTTGSDGSLTGNHHELTANSGGSTTTQVIGPLASAASADFSFDMWNGPSGSKVVWSVTGSISGVLASGTAFGSSAAWTATSVTGLSIAAGETITLSFTAGSSSTAGEHIDGVSLLVTPVDETAPEISLDLSATSLWPPNHKMRLVASGISASDDSDPSPSVTVEVSSNEPVNGPGDGDTEPDWNVVDNGDGTFDVWVRAERSGKGGGRVYTILVSAMDASGNNATSTAEVTVGHDRRASKPVAGIGAGGPLDTGAFDALGGRFGLENGGSPEFGLHQNFPNPFNPSTTIRYTLAETSNMRLVIYNVLGQEIRVLARGVQPAGSHTVVWDGRDALGRQVSTGLYLYRLQAAGRVVEKKMLFAK